MENAYDLNTMLISVAAFSYVAQGVLALDRPNKAQEKLIPLPIAFLGRVAVAVAQVAMLFIAFNIVITRVLYVGDGIWAGIVLFSWIPMFSKNIKALAEVYLVLNDRTPDQEGLVAEETGSLPAEVPQAQ